MRYQIFIFGFLVLAACSQGLPIQTATTDVQFFGPGAGTEIRRMDSVEIRSISGPIFRAREFSGAECALRGTGYRADFTTPARVRLPVYDGRTDSVNIVCRANGRRMSSEFEAVNLTGEAIDEGISISTGSNGTSIRASISLRDRSKDRFDYPTKLEIRF